MVAFQGHIVYFFVFPALATNLTPLMSLNNEAQMIHNFNMSSMSFSQPQSQIGTQPASASRLNPKAPEYSSVYSSMQNKNNASALYNGYPVNVPNNMYAANKGAMEVSFKSTSSINRPGV